MVRNNSEKNKKNQGTNRRSVLKNMAVLGALSAAAPRVGASPDDKNIKLGSVLSSPKVKRVKKAIPGLKLDRQNAAVFGKDGSLIVIPANYGKLLATTDNEAASFYFDEWVAGVDKNWPQEAEARLTAEGDGLLFQRGATDSEKRQFISAINRSEYDEKRTNVMVTPGRGEITFTHANHEEREVETLTAVTQQGFTESIQTQSVTEKGDTEEELTVVDRSTFTASDLTQTDSTSSGQTATTSGATIQAAPPGCHADAILDLVLCVTDYADCSFCFLASTLTGPVAVACWIIVCLDGGLSFAMEYLTDWGCYAFGEEVYDCLRYIVDEYGHLVPEPPTANG
ncbi:hypothetical protein ACH9L7_02355 [Haloferax sp. S1W]|uniref:hypothetical protein n=1 Tax=Haloferax sp. S1W TaxID=3377110 RepID=UPI0037CBC806